MKISKDMSDLFYKRTNEHVDRVKRNGLRLMKGLLSEDNTDISLTDFAVQIGDHDWLKFKYPELNPYIIRTSKMRAERLGTEFPQLSEGLLDEIDRAVYHHVAHTPHHPEHWDEDITLELFQQNQRRPGTYKTIAYDMDNESIAEMVCDWTAVSQEFGGNSALDWAKSNVNYRWQFTPEQTELIFHIIDILDNN